MSELPAPARVTVVMLTYGAHDWVRRAIGAVRTHTDVPYQLVVVDNASPDGTADWLRNELSAGELVALDENVGYAAGNDLGANLATAPVLCFLNSDAIVPPGWAAPLLAPFDDATVAATVPLYVDPDGTVQEAGCNVADDAVVTPLGRADDPTVDEYRWPRAVQHASAACLLVRSSAFRAVGGFDAGYGIGYYEDVELVAALQARGGRVLLVPDVHVTHAHAASTPDAAAADARVAANRPRFVARHTAYLAWRHHAFDLTNERHRYFAARDAQSPERTLLLFTSVSHDAPLRSLRSLLSLAPDDTVASLVTVASTTPSDVAGVRRLRRRGVEVVEVAGPASAAVESLLAARLFHYSRIGGSRETLATWLGAIERHQPQAEIVVLN